MSLVNWAKEELDRLNKDNDGMQEAMNNNIIEIVKVFSEQGHTGFTASYALGLIKKLLAWKPITPLTGEEDEWCEVCDTKRNLQQNKRYSSVFRENFDNSTAYDIEGRIFSDDGGKTWFTRGRRGSSVPVTFPYTVPEKPEYVLIEPEKE